MSRAKVTDAGSLTAAFTDDSGRISVVAHDSQGVYGLTWVPGEQPSGWVPLLDGVGGLSSLALLAVDAGDVVVFLGDNTADGTHLFVTLTAGGGWGPPRVIDDLGVDGRLQRVDLSPDGHTFGLWTRASAEGTTTTLTSIGVDAAEWSASRVVLRGSDQVFSASLDARVGRSAVFALFTRAGYVLGVVTGDGVTHTLAPQQPWTLCYLRSDPPDAGRFVLVEGERLQLVEFRDGGWSTYDYTRQSPGANVVAINRQGDLVFA